MVPDNQSKQDFIRNLLVVDSFCLLAGIGLYYEMASLGFVVGMIAGLLTGLGATYWWGIEFKKKFVDQTGAPSYKLGAASTLLIGISAAVGIPFIGSFPLLTSLVGWAVAWTNVFFLGITYIAYRHMPS